MNGRSLWSGCPASPPLRVCWWPEGGRGLQQRATPSLWSQTRGRYLTWPRAQLALMKHRGGWGPKPHVRTPPSVLPAAQSLRLPHQGPWTGRERIRGSAVLAQDTGQNACRSRLRGPLTLFVHLSLFWKHCSFPYREGGEGQWNAEHLLSNDVLSGSVGCNEAA